MARNIGDAYAIKIVNCRAQSSGIGDVAGTGFKALRLRLIERLLEGDILNHVAATLPRRYVLQHLGLAKDNPDAGESKTLCPENT